MGAHIFDWPRAHSFSGHRRSTLAKLTPGVECGQKVGAAGSSVVRGVRTPSLLELNCRNLKPSELIPIQCLIGEHSEGVLKMLLVILQNIAVRINLHLAYRRTI